MNIGDLLGKTGSDAEPTVEWPASHPGGVEILLIASDYGNQVKDGLTGLICLTFL